MASKGDESLFFVPIHKNSLQWQTEKATGVQRPKGPNTRRRTLQQALFESKQSHFQLIYGKQPRDVMVCMRTGRTIDFQSPELIGLRDRICEELGWSPVGHRFQIFAMSPETLPEENGDEPIEDGSNPKHATAPKS